MRGPPFKLNRVAHFPVYKSQEILNNEAFEYFERTVKTSDFKLNYFW